MSRLGEIKARADVATPGPWHAWDRGIGWEVHKGEECAPGCGRSCDALNGEFRDTFTRADAEFIAAAREDEPWLVSEVERLTAERDALAAQVARVEALGEKWLAMDEANADYFSRERLDPTLVARVATIRQERLQAALAAPTETDDLERCDCGRVVPCRHCDPTGQEDSPDAGHRCEPYYSRAECGQCGWQEQWCVTCSRKMCGCATDTTDQDAMGADQ